MYKSKLQNHLSPECRLCSTRFLWVMYMEIKQLKSLFMKALNLKTVFRARSISHCIRTRVKKKKKKKKEGGYIPNILIQKDDSAIFWIFKLSAKDLSYYEVKIEIILRTQKSICCSFHARMLLLLFEWQTEVSSGEGIRKTL